ncbi:hypothetical protein [Geobacter sp. OR-1]|uniref:hypothetical protein n=1 Tax=Geobacter sp. OR-1 TaxID=1266765 RepID=UPI00126A7878|nr:hypothetical protein [Geobacter sp. OR-1]
MNNTSQINLHSLADKAINSLFITSVFISAIIYLLHIVTHFPFFDGSIHTRYLWLLSSGFKANVDFFCIYPTLGYFLTLPYFKLFPESAFVLLALRLFSAVVVALLGLAYYSHGRRISADWVVALLPFLLISTDRSIGVFFSEYSIDHLAALAAILAMTIIMSEPGFFRLALCSALSLISLFIMPKYHFPLFFGLLGYLWVCYATYRKPSMVISGLCAGAISALAIIFAIFSLNHGSIIDNFKYAYLFNFRFTSVLDEQIGSSPMYSPVIVYVWTFLRHHLLLSFSYAVGIYAWLRYAVSGWRKPDPLIWGGGGILLGCFLATLFDAVYCEQYITPVLLCLALFVPVAYSETVSSQRTIRYARYLFVTIAFAILVARLDRVADEFHLTAYNARGNTATTRTIIGEVTMAPTGINILNEYDDLLALIPKDETVVAAWPFHPLFRRDAAFQIFDDRPSLSGAFQERDPLSRSFAPETFMNALEKSAPALIVPQNLDEFFPPGWDLVVQDFLSRHRHLYEEYATNMYKGYIRKDLLE